MERLKYNTWYRLKSTGEKVLIYIGYTYGCVRGGEAVTRGPQSDSTPFFQVDTDDLVLISQEEME